MAEKIHHAETEAFLSHYEREVSTRNFRKAQFTFVDFNPTISKFGLNLISILYYKIDLLQKTPDEMLSIRIKDNVLFEDLRKKYELCSKNYWLRIDKNILLKLDEKHLFDMITITSEMVELLEKIFNYFFNNDDKNHQDINSIACDLIVSSEQKLDRIMPIFSILAIEEKLTEKIQQIIKETKASEETVMRTKKEVEDLGKEQRIESQKAKEAAVESKTSEEAVKVTKQEVEEIKKAVEDLGKKHLLNFESLYFGKTAKRHELKCILFLTMAFVLGAATVAWGILSQYFFERQDEVCKDADVLFNFFPCWLLDIHVKDLLVGGVLVMGIVACLRAYFANAHSASISRHRFNSLQIYSRGGKLIDPKDRDVFLQKATEAIFEQLPTGFTKYHKEDSKSSDNSAQLALIASIVNRATRGGGS